MARILIVGGGCRGRRLAQTFLDAGHAVRITTRCGARRAAIERCGAECWLGTPDRLATLRGALENVTLACWLLGAATGEPAQVSALHSSRLESFLWQAIDTTLRGFIYEAAGTTVPHCVLARGERIARRLANQNAIPLAVLNADLRAHDTWLSEARHSVERLLEARAHPVAPADPR